MIQKRETYTGERSINVRIIGENGIFLVAVLLFGKKIYLLENALKQIKVFLSTNIENNIYFSIPTLQKTRLPVCLLNYLTLKQAICAKKLTTHHSLNLYLRY